MSIYDYLILAVIAAMVAAVFIHRAVQKKKGILIYRPIYKKKRLLELIRKPNIWLT